MDTAFPILYPLRSASEVVFVDQALLKFRAGEENTSEGLDLSKMEYSHLTHAQRLTVIAHEWSLDSLREIKPWVLHNETVLAVLDLCAANPETWITFKAACKAASMIGPQGRGQMQALTKKTRNHLGKRSWPVVANAAPPGVAGLGYYMSKVIADRWKQVRAEA